MDKLKQFIDTNRDAFESDPLPEGHFERFEQRLAEASPKRKRRPLYLLWSSVAAAAAIALLLLLRLPGESSLPGETSQPVAAQQAPDEIEELQLYYQMQINELLAQMEKLYENDRTPGTQELLQETKRILRDNYMFEETVLPTLPAGNIGLLAVTKHYNSSVETLSIMLEQMQRIAKEDKKSSYKTEQL